MEACGCGLRGANNDGTHDGWPHTSMLMQTLDASFWSQIEAHRGPFSSTSLIFAVSFLHGRAAEGSHRRDAGSGPSVGAGLALPRAFRSERCLVETLARGHLLLRYRVAVITSPEAAWCRRAAHSFRSNLRLIVYDRSRWRTRCSVSDKTNMLEPA